MRTLVLIRHAKSDWSTGRPDEQRPLNERGRRDAPALGAWLAEHVGTIELVVCSPAVRTRETWALAGERLGQSPPVRYEREVYAASPRTLASIVDNLPADLRTVALVGHNPGMSELAEQLSGESFELRTCAVVVLSWEGDWAEAVPSAVRVVLDATPRG